MTDHITCPRCGLLDGRHVGDHEDAEIIAGAPTSGGSSWRGDHWEWFAEWSYGGRVLKRVDGKATDSHDVVNQTRALCGLPAIDDN